MRTKEELKEIFLKQAEYILDNHMNKLMDMVNNIPNNEETSKEQYKDVLSIANSLKKQDKITDEELNFIKDHMLDWQQNLLPLILNRLTLH